MNRADLRALLSSRIEQPIARLLAALGLSPNAITVLGMLGAVAAGILASQGLLLAAGAATLVAGILDLFDGSVARLTGRKSKFGALLDSTADRVSEAAVLIGLAVYYAGEESLLGVALSCGAMAGSMMVSYVRARAGGLRVDCEVGVFTRPERVAAMGAGLIAGQWLECRPPRRPRRDRRAYGHHHSAARSARSPGAGWPVDTLLIPIRRDAAT